MPSGCAIFNGTSAFGRYNPGATVLGALPLTICMWLKPANAGAINLAGLSTTTINVSAYARQNADKAAGIRNNGAAVAIGATAMSIGTWYSLCAVCTDSDTHIYLDGVLDGTDGTNVAAANWTNIVAGGF